jgi:4-carboxymuconolactone decarboxylase
MDSPAHKELYDKGYEMRKKVVGEEYVAAALQKGSGDFMRPLQQFATVCCPFSIYSLTLLSNSLLHF